MPRFGLHPQLEHDRNVPSNYNGRGSEPAKHGIRRNQTQREAMQEDDRRFCSQDQRRRHGHKQEMLHHMKQEQSMVEGGERRSNRGPQHKYSAHKR
jgi:hypothetical protein